MTLLNIHQPVRPRTTEDGQSLLRYRTYPSLMNKRMMKFTDPRSMIAQARLYRFARSEHCVNHIAISEMYDWVFGDQPLVPKKTMGGVVIQTVVYNPRVLLGLSKMNDKQRVIYRFERMIEFQYGLEWMICTWLRKFLNDTAAPGAAPVLGPDMMSDELDMLANCSEREYKEVYEEMLWDFKMAEPDWLTLTGGKPEIIRVPLAEKRMEPPKSYGFSAKPAS